MADTKIADSGEETLDDLINSNEFKQLSATDRFKRLQAKQTELEQKIKALMVQIPQEFRNLKEKPKFIDEQGFPRGDIDIWTINGIRKDAMPLQNDHVKVMQLIESTMIQVFAERKQQQASQQQETIVQTEATQVKAASENKTETENDNDESNKSRETSLYALKPFYLVDSIFTGSPAQEAGLKSGDLVIQFGSMVNENKSPQLLQEIVKSSINKAIPVTIKRNPEGFLGLQLTPKQWQGKGLLGCHLTPYQEK